MIVTTISEQTIFDVVLWKYGTLQQISKLVRDNNITYDYLPPVGTQMSFFANFGNEDYKNYFERNNFIPVSFVKVEVTGGVGYWFIESDFIVQ